MKTIGFIGGGRVTNILLQGFKKAGITFEKVVVFDINQETTKSLKQKYPDMLIADSIQDTVKDAELLIIAVHPPVLMDVLNSVKENLNQDTVIISLAPKITIEKISTALGGVENIARLNPSASSFVGKGVNPITFSVKMKNEIREQLIQLLSTLGSTPVVEEAKIEAYAMISAMGPTYFFFQLQKLKELAVSFGMEEQEAQKVISDMLWGATETLFKSGLSYSEVIDLIPVKPMGEAEEIISGYYDNYLNAIFNKIKP